MHSIANFLFIIRIPLHVIFFRYGTEVLSLKPFIQPIVNLLGDPSGPVRDTAINTLVEVYKHVGEFKSFVQCTIYQIKSLESNQKNRIGLASKLHLFNEIFFYFFHGR